MEVDAHDFLVFDPTLALGSRLWSVSARYLELRSHIATEENLKKWDALKLAVSVAGDFEEGARQRVSAVGLTSHSALQLHLETRHLCLGSLLFLLETCTLSANVSTSSP